jgi:hypothetical protein
MESRLRCGKAMEGDEPNDGWRRVEERNPAKEKSARATAKIKQNGRRIRALIANVFGMANTLFSLRPITSMVTSRIAALRLSISDIGVCSVVISM